MGIIETVRREREDLARVLKKHKGIRRVVEDLYPDTAHFLYELLQNAEDTGATQATFTLSENSLKFEHNGRPFEDRDIYAITDIGEGTKSGDEDMIGQFGIGFKAVFAYSETPHIWSPTFSFKITDLVLPIPLDDLPELKGHTRFVFPFNNPKKRSCDAYAEVSAGLSEFALTTLLFLSHLKSISWSVDGRWSTIRRSEHGENHVEVVRQIANKDKARAHFLKFEQSVKGLERQRLALAFELGHLTGVRRFNSHESIEKQFAIVPARPGRVAVYFPAAKETSGLRFHVHAPFVPELSRASVKETPANQPLFEQLAELAAQSLHKVRDLGLLTPPFLAVLPNPHDILPDRYKCIRSAIVEEMKTQPLTPTHSKSHAPAERLLQGKAILKALLNNSDLAILVPSVKEPSQWAISSTQKNNDIDRFLSGLGIRPWDLENFLQLIRVVGRDHYGRVQDERLAGWFASKSPSWHQELYALLYEELNSAGLLWTVEHAQLVRKSDGSYSTGNGCYFPSEDVEHDETHPRVDAAVLKAGKNRGQQEKARKFLEGVGVREVGEADQVQVILQQRYSEEAEVPDQKTYLRDLRRFVSLVENDPDAANMFENFWVLESEDLWRKANEIFLDTPFVESGLRVYHERLPEDASERRWALARHYKKCGIAGERLLRFARAIGVQDRLPVQRQSSWRHPFRWDLQGGTSGSRQTNTCIDEDWIIPGLEFALSQPTAKLAQLLWRTLQSLERSCLKARYRPNRQYAIRETPSSLVLLLRKHKWIPQGRSEFVRPRDATAKRLPKGFDFEPDWPWLKEIEFGENDARKQEERREKQAMARKMGFRNVEELERAQKFASLPQEAQQRLLAAAEKEGTSGGERSKNDHVASKSQGGMQSKKDMNRESDENERGARKTTASNKRTLGRTSGTARNKFISYVAVQPNDDEPDPDGLDHETRISLEEQAIAIIVSEEPQLRRTSKNNRGYDLFEENSGRKKTRWIEVKAMAGSLNDRPVGMSHTQFKLAQEHGRNYWLYIVEHAGSDEARVVRIQDPAGKAKTFTFDQGWIDIAADR